MCGVCGAVPFNQGRGSRWLRRARQGQGRASAPVCVPPLVLTLAPGGPARAAHHGMGSISSASRIPRPAAIPAAVVRLGMSGSSLGWPCGSGNCSGLPLGFLGQAVIISGKPACWSRQRQQGHCVCADYGLPDWVLRRSQLLTPLPARPPPAAILLVLVTLCLWRRIWLFRRHGSDGQRSGLGLVRATVTPGRVPRPPRDGMMDE